MRRPKVLFVINSMAGGGAERVMNTLLRQTIREGRAVDLSLALLDDEPVAYPLPEGLEVDLLDARGSLLHSCTRLDALVRRRRPDRIVSFLTRSNLATLYASRRNKVRAVISERVATSSHLAGRKPADLIGRLLVRLAYPHADRIIAVSQGVADDLRAHFGVRPERVVVIANPVDVAEIRERGLVGERSQQGVYTLGMGRLAANKNFALLVRAFARAQIPGRLIILGQGPEREALEALAAELGIADRFELPGYSSNPFPTVAGAAIYVLPSNAEGFPNGLIEAMALGRPVIATNCASGPSEILDDKAREQIKGLTFAAFGVLTPQDDEEQMAEALRRLCSEPGLRASYGEKAEGRAAAFSVERASNAYWREILGRDASSV